MRNWRLLRSLKFAAVAVVLAGGTLTTSMCTSRDIQQNVVSGTLTYLKNGTTSFWNHFIPIDSVWAGLFNPEFDSQTPP